MRHSLIFIFLLLTSQIHAKIKNPFATLEYDSVMLYSYPDGWNKVVDDSGHLEKSINQRVLLSDSIVTVLNKKLSATASYGQNLVGCFSPHMGFVWYKNGQIIGCISICLQCRQFYADLPISKYDHDYHPLSSNFRIFFNNLRQHYGFPEYKESIYNEFPPAILKTDLK